MAVLKANFISIDGREEQHPEGSYYIEWYDGSEAPAPIRGEECARGRGKTPSASAAHWES
jgi:hypothetical protein